VLFGTRTTIGSGEHIRRLALRGMDPRPHRRGAVPRLGRGHRQGSRFSDDPLALSRNAFCGPCRGSPEAPPSMPGSSAPTTPISPRRSGRRSAGAPVRKVKILDPCERLVAGPHEGIGRCRLKRMGKGHRRRGRLQSRASRCSSGRPWPAPRARVAEDGPGLDQSTRRDILITSLRENGP